MAPTIRQLHSSDYRNPSQLEGAVLVVGSGNSGAEIALEAAGSGHPTWLSGRHLRTDSPPNRVQTSEARYPGVMFPGPPSAQCQHTDGSQGTCQSERPCHAIGTHQRVDLEAAGVIAMPRIDGTDQGRPVTADGDVLNPSNHRLVHGSSGRPRLDRNPWSNRRRRSSSS